MKGGKAKKKSKKVKERKTQQRFILPTASVEGKARWSTTLRRLPAQKLVRD